MSASVKRFAWMSVFLLLAFSLCRAGLSRFQERERAIRQACAAQAPGAVKPKYPTPEIRIVSAACLQPGGTGEVVIQGNLPPNSKFVFENDNIEVLKESVTAGVHRITLKAAAGTGPQTANVTALTPNCRSARADNAVVVTGKYEWVMNAANGWKIVARSPSGKSCGGPPTPGDPYDLAFYRRGETTPFEMRSATLYFSVYEDTNYRFNVSNEDPAVKAGTEDFTNLMQKLADPKLSDAQRDAIMKRLTAAQAQMQANMQKMMDPTYAKAQQAKREEFGCERIELKAPGPNFTGRMRCSQKVGINIGITGTLASLSR